MTCIVAIEDGSRSWIAADTGVTSGDGAKDNAKGKAWIHEPSGVAFGVAGNLSLCQAVRYGIRVPKPSPKMSGMEWCVRRLVPAIRRALGDSPQVDENGLIEMHMVVAVRGEVYEIDPSLAVTRSPRGYTSIGSGADFAHGSLFSTKKQPPKRRACLAVESACAHHAGCSLPIEVLCVGGDA